MTATWVDGGPSQGGVTIAEQVKQDGWLVGDIQGPKVNCQGINAPRFGPSQPRCR
jgi:hypothetical protein